MKLSKINLQSTGKAREIKIKVPNTAGIFKGQALTDATDSVMMAHGRSGRLSLEATAIS